MGGVVDGKGRQLPCAKELGHMGSLESASVALGLASVGLASVGVQWEESVALGLASLGLASVALGLRLRIEEMWS